MVMDKNECAVDNDPAIQKPCTTRPQSDCMPTQNKRKSHCAVQQATRITADNIYENCINYNSDSRVHVSREQTQSTATEIPARQYSDRIIGAYKSSALEHNSKLFGKPPSGEKYAKQFFGLSLDEREMPITRERSKIYQPNTVKRCSDDSSRVRKIKLNGSPRLHHSSKCLDSYSDRLRHRYVLQILLLSSRLINRIINISK